MPEPDGQGVGGKTLASRIDRLFDVVRRPNGTQFSYEEVARACREASGETFSATYLWQLRTGQRDNPTKRHLESLAQFFDVPISYFFEDGQGSAVVKELKLLHALRDARVRSVALRAVELSPDGIDMISEMIDLVARREKSQEPGTRDRSES